MLKNRSLPYIWMFGLLLSIIFTVTYKANAQDALKVSNLAVELNNGTSTTAYVRTEGLVERQVAPGDSVEIRGFTTPKMVVETRVETGQVPNQIFVTQNKDGAIDGNTSRLVVENELAQRIEVYLEGTWAGTLATGSSFVQKLKAGTYQVTISDPTSKAGLVERSLEIGTSKTLTWKIGGFSSNQAGYLTFYNVGDAEVALTVNDVDRGTVLAGRERTFLDIKPKAAPVSAEEKKLKAPKVWAGAEKKQASENSVASGQNTTDASSLNIEPGHGISQQDLEVSATQNLQKRNVGTLKLGNQTDRTMKFFINGTEVAVLEPTQEKVFQEQPLGEYLVEAEDLRGGAYVRARVAIVQSGQIVVWNAKGWF